MKDEPAAGINMVRLRAVCAHAWISSLPSTFPHESSRFGFNHQVIPGKRKSRERSAAWPQRDQPLRQAAR
jgi:hypothetical protein